MRRTRTLADVAKAFMTDPDAHHWGYDLTQRSGIRSGVMYPILQRMLAAGWLTDGWETTAQTGKRARPPRRYYEVTPLGRAALADLAGKTSAGCGSGPAGAATAGCGMRTPVRGTPADGNSTDRNVGSA